MRNISTIYYKLFFALILGLTLTSSCKKDKIEVSPKPELTKPAGPDTITLGENVVLRPQLSSKQNVTYQWSVDGTRKSTDSIFTFTPEARGDYQISFTATSTGGATSATYSVHVYEQYENGFFVVNEGWYGHGPGTLGFYRYDKKVLEDSVYTKANPGKNLDPATSTLEHGTIFNGKLYLTSKAGGPLVAVDQYSLKETARINAAGGNDWRAFTGIDDTKALVTSGDGVYQVTLPNLTLGSKLAAINGEAADILKAGNYIFVLTQNDGVVILKSSDYSVAKKIAGLEVAFARTPDGSIWAAGGTKLVKINPNTLDVQNITLPFTANGSWGAWHPGSIIASTKNNTVFIAANGPYSGGTEIYRYIDGNAGSLSTAFITVPDGKELYGAGLGFDAKLNQVVVTTVQSGYGENYSFNDLYFYDANTGQQKYDFAHRGYYFPAVPVFH